MTSRSMVIATRLCVIRDDLNAGFGVEDIAVRYPIPVAYVRGVVSKMRATGDLKNMFKGSKI